MSRTGKEGGRGRGRERGRKRERERANHVPASVYLQARQRKPCSGDECLQWIQDKEWGRGSQKLGGVAKKSKREQFLWFATLSLPYFPTWEYDVCAISKPVFCWNHGNAIGISVPPRGYLHYPDIQDSLPISCGTTFFQWTLPRSSHWIWSRSLCSPTHSTWEPSPCISKEGNPQHFKESSNRKLKEIEVLSDSIDASRSPIDFLLLCGLCHDSCRY